MEWCLYHPEFGYYSSERTIVGREGDYYTSPCVHPIFGGLIAKQLQQFSQILEGSEFEVIELGGGRGFLCLDILDWARKELPGFYAKLRYGIVETSQPLVMEQKERLSRYEGEEKVFWTDPDQWDPKAGMTGCVLSNEFFDALPVHRVLMQGGAIKELYVAERDDRFEEVWDEPSDPAVIDYFTSMAVPLHEGQKAEVCLDALLWMDRIGVFLKKGFVLTIDYGYLAEDLYDPGRRGGTLISYFQNRISEDPLKNVGRQDITAHVNFTALIRVGERRDLQFTGMVPQYRFLMGLGLVQEMEAWTKDSSALDALEMRLSVKHLVDPEVGMGETMKVLVQHKGIDTPQLEGLRGLRSVLS
jgi:SAM-dependent MidA family methyltransferase